MPPATAKIATASRQYRRRRFMTPLVIYPAPAASQHARVGRVKPRRTRGRVPKGDLSLPVSGDGTVGSFLSFLVGRARGPHPTSLSLGHPPRKRLGCAHISKFRVKHLQETLDFSAF